MTTDYIKKKLLEGGVIEICKHRKIKDAWEHFLVKKNGVGTKITSRQSKSVQRFLATRINLIKKSTNAHK